MNKHLESEGDGDVCPLCNYFNAPMALDTCEHFYGSVWDGDLDFSKKLGRLHDLWIEAIEYIESDNDQTALINNRMLKSFEKKVMRYTNSNSMFIDFLTNALDAKLGEGWSTDGMLSGSGYNIYFSGINKIERAEYFFQNFVPKEN